MNDLISKPEPPSASSTLNSLDESYSFFSNKAPNMYGGQTEDDLDEDEVESEVCIPDAVDLARLYEQVSVALLQTHLLVAPKLAFQIDRGSVDLMVRKPTRSVSIDTVSVKLTEVTRDRLRVVEKFGEGQFGEIHLCHLVCLDDEGNETAERKLVAVKSLKIESTENARLMGMMNGSLTFFCICFISLGPISSTKLAF
jgi:hypothetical protein